MFTEKEEHEEWVRQERAALSRAMIFAGDAEPVAANLLAIRKRFVKEREEMAALQKTSPDRDTARFFKEESADRMKHYRGTCALIPWFCATDDIPGDCVHRDLNSMPPELCAYAVRALCFATVNA